MTTSDRTIDLDLRLEVALRELFAGDPPAPLTELMDARVDAALAGRLARRPARLRRRSVALLAAATVAVAGAGTGLLTQYGELIGPLAGYSLALARSEEIGLSEVVDGYRVTLDRGYLDAASLVLGVRVQDELERAEVTQVMAMAAVVSDDAGTYESMGFATSGPIGRWTAVNVVPRRPPELPLPAGERELRVVIPAIMVRDDATPPPVEDQGWSPWREVAGPWTFELTLPVNGGGTVADIAASAEVHGIVITAHRIVAAASTVRVELTIEGATELLGPIGELRHAGRTLRAVGSGLDDDGRISVLFEQGVADPRGTWTLEIDQLTGNGAPIEGPWILDFEVP